MVKTNRDLELEAAENRIEAVEGEIKEIQKFAKLANTIIELEADVKYKAVVEDYILNDEADRLCGYLKGSDVLSENDVKALNEGLVAIRGFKSIIANTKKLGSSSEENIASCRMRIKEENKYMGVVAMCKDDLSDLDDRLGE